jgi:hypothetical protein
MPPTKSKKNSVANKHCLKGVGIFANVRGSHKRNDLFFPIGSTVFPKTAQMDYSQYLVDSGRKGCIEKNLISPYVVRVDTKDRSPIE